MGVLTYLAFLTAVGGMASDRPEPRPFLGGRVRDVQLCKMFFENWMSERSGVVTEVSKEGITLLMPPGGGGKEAKVENFPVISLLADGGVHEKAEDAFAYRLADVIKGDTVTIHVVQDDDTKERYCVEIQIQYRPKGAIPASTKPAARIPYHERANVLNDLFNDREVDDGLVDRVCPKFVDKSDLPGGPDKVYREGMPKSLKAKYEAQLAKRQKEQEAKAKLPEKKDDKK